MADLVELINPVTGQVAPFAQDQVPGALANGYVEPPTPDALALAQHTTQVRNDAKGALGGLGAFLESGASTLTLGGSSWLQRALGADPEAMRAREEEHPFASAAGGVIGAALPIILSGGAAAPEEAAVEGGAEAGAGLKAGGETLEDVVAAANKGTKGSLSTDALKIERAHTQDLLNLLNRNAMEVGRDAAYDQEYDELTAKIERLDENINDREVKGAEAARNFSPEPGTFGDWDKQLGDRTFNNPIPAAPATPRSLASTIADWTGPGLISRAGKAVKGGLEGALPSGIADWRATENLSNAVTEMGEDAGHELTATRPGTDVPINQNGLPSLGKRLLSRAVSSAAGYGVEGGLYGLGDVNHEAALDNPMSVGEAAAHIGLSALLAGGVGAAGGVLGELGSTYAPKLIEELNKLKVAKYGEQLGLSKEGSKINASTIDQATERGWLHPFSNPDSVVSKAIDTLSKETDNFQELLDRTANNPRTAFKGVGEWYGKTGLRSTLKDWLVTGVDGASPTYTKLYGQEARKILAEFDSQLDSKYGSWIPNAPSPEDVLTGKPPRTFVGGKGGLHVVNDDQEYTKVPVTYADMFNLYRRLTSIGHPDEQNAAAEWLQDNILDKHLGKTGGKLREAWESWKDTRDVAAQTSRLMEQVKNLPEKEGKYGALDIAEVAMGMHGGPLGALGTAAEHYVRKNYGAGLTGELAKQLKKVAGVFPFEGTAPAFEVSHDGMHEPESDFPTLRSDVRIPGFGAVGAETGREASKLASQLEEKDRPVAGAPVSDIPEGERPPRNSRMPNGEPRPAAEILGRDRIPSARSERDPVPASLDPRTRVQIPFTDPQQTAAGMSILAATEKRIKDRMAEGAASILSGKVSETFGSAASKSSAEVAKVVEGLSKLAQDPSALSNHLENALGPLHIMAPQVAFSAGSATARAVQYLQTAAPRPHPPSLMEPEGGPVSEYEKNQFARQVQAVLDPIAALVRTPTPSTMDVINQVYPALAGQMKQELLGSLAQQQKPSYQDVLKISALVGSPLSMGQIFAPPIPANIPLSTGGLGRGIGTKVRGSKAGAGKMSRDLYRLPVNEPFGSKGD